MLSYYQLFNKADPRHVIIIIAYQVTIKVKVGRKKTAQDKNNEDYAQGHQDCEEGNNPQKPDSEAYMDGYTDRQKLIDMRKDKYKGKPSKTATVICVSNFVIAVGLVFYRCIFYFKAKKNSKGITSNPLKLTGKRWRE